MIIEEGKGEVESANSTVSGKGNRREKWQRYGQRQRRTRERFDQFL